MGASVKKAEPRGREAFPAPSRPTSPAHIIRTDEEAVAVARKLAAQFAEGAAERDRDRRLPTAELDIFSQSGLWGITVPRAFGGAGVSQATVAEVFKIIAAADPSLAQIPQNHFEITDLIRATGSDAQKQALFGLVLSGLRLGNAFSEFKGKNVEDFETLIARHGDGYVVNGEKFYSTGALFAHLVPIVAIDEDGKVRVAIVDRDAPGLEIIDDWSSFGQRTTASGTVVIRDVAAPAERVLPAHLAYDQASPAGPQSQLVHASIDAGIARGAIETTIRLVRDHARPWIDSGKERASDDPYTIAQIGELKIRLHAAEALLKRAAHEVDRAISRPEIDAIALAKVAVAEAKVLTTDIAIQATNKLFELAGTRSTLAAHHLDRLWRDARTHTLHDPVRWKYHAVGQYYLNGVNPPLHSWI
ncbi:MAG: SfnB family sulfur acquisition oxidoreductase [Mesorhizobium sp.]|uniref:SfnB family sulfur acquisition oxidoreductase n=1 Tax=Mesorhizobium sp. TaxID=1871066 RepID=UPI000FE73060|nr:SfnB family sulfur acquisition oxidoreductase [Mesorhizobium sp.]RWF05631.1 MAG: SfnB family sulfur acquisition oxidoreductase [Mesorhizobium sp.]TIV61882.1 MAG: SfnB family sulfur acquisition oxidoreductase [Mesorhizobium sp.]